MSAGRVPPRRRGFTLIEVLVSLGIIAVLMSLLLPAVMGARGGARTAQSLSNLRQMVIAGQLYADDHRAWPVAVRYETHGAGLRTFAWDWVQDAHGLVGPGPLWSYTDWPDRVLQCPEYHGSADFGADPFTGYNYNTSFLGGEAPWPQTGWEVIRPGVRVGAHRRTATVAVFGAGGRRGGTNKFMRSPGNPEGLDAWTLHAGGQGFRYRGERTVVAWLDGHVSADAAPHLSAISDDAVAEDVMGWPDNGFLSVDDRAYDPR